MSNPLQRYAARLKQLKEQATDALTWPQVAASADVDKDRVRRIVGGEVRPTETEHKKLLSVFGRDPHLQACFEALDSGRRTRSRGAGAGVLQDFVGRWYQEIPAGRVTWQRRPFIRTQRTVDEISLSAKPGLRVDGFAVRIVGAEEELGKMWRIDGRVIVEDASLLLTFADVAERPDKSRGVIALRLASRRKDRLEGLYAILDYEAQLFVPRPLVWCRSAEGPFAADG